MVLFELLHRIGFTFLNFLLFLTNQKHGTFLESNFVRKL